MAARKKAGRPRVTGARVDGRRNRPRVERVPLVIYCAPRLKKAVERAADVAEMTTAGFVREILEERIEDIRADERRAARVSSEQDSASA